MGRPTPAHRLPATTSTHPEARRCRPTCQPDSSPRRTLTPPTLPHASNRLRTTLRFVAAIPCTPPAHHRTSLLWSPSSDFVPRQPRLCLLTRHGDADGVLRRDEVIEALGVLGNGELDALDPT